MPCIQSSMYNYVFNYSKDFISVFLFNPTFQHSMLAINHYFILMKLPPSKPKCLLTTNKQISPFFYIFFMTMQSPSFSCTPTKTPFINIYPYFSLIFTLLLILIQQCCILSPTIQSTIPQILLNPPQSSVGDCDECLLLVLSICATSHVKQQQVIDYV